jgi:hypothetical protein
VNLLQDAVLQIRVVCPRGRHMRGFRGSMSFLMTTAAETSVG